MSRKLVLLTVLTIFLTSILGLAIKVQRVKASGPIYIRADGLVEPSTELISSIDNVTYTFTGDIYDSIVVERSNITIDGNGYTLQGFAREYGFNLTSITNVTIQNTNIKGFDVAIRLQSASNNTISKNNISENSDLGIFLLYSSNNTIYLNTIKNSARHGILLIESSSNRIYSNEITENGDIGISISAGLNISSNNLIDANNIAENQNGICLGFSSNNIISRNNVINSKFTGIRLWSSSYRWSSSNNKIYHNNFVNNTHQTYVLMPGYANIWDNGYPSGGNYWSDYNGTDSDYDGIGDTAYIVDANNTDSFPLMGLFYDFNATSKHYVQTISNSTISSFQFNGTAITFNVSGENGTTGFCRICIPTALMNDTYKVSVNGTEVRYTLLSFTTHNYLYFTYKHSTQRVVITSFIQPFPWDLVAWACAGVLASCSGFFGYLYLKTRLKLKKVHTKIAKIRERKSANICPGCGIQNKPEAKFCRKCGRSL